jgi:hypothetical protein
MTEGSKQRLEALRAAGGQVVRVDDLGQIDADVAKITPTLKLDPPSPDIRVVTRRWPGGGAAFLVNEGHKPYRGSATIRVDGKLGEIEPVTGMVRAIDSLPSPAGGKAGGEGGDRAEVQLPRPPGTQVFPLNLDGWQSTLLVAQSRDAPAAIAPPAAHGIAQSVDLADAWTARVDRQYVVGKHDFETHVVKDASGKPAALGGWAKALGLGEDFSGHVTYRRTVKVPESMRGGRLLLDVGNVQYAARVSVDSRKVGYLLWSPWRIELPALKNPAEFVLEIQVSNTLANEITSQRVRDEWGKHKEPGWPSGYHSISLKFEFESRGGGLFGPVRLLSASDHGPRQAGYAVKQPGDIASRAPFRPLALPMDQSLFPDRDMVLSMIALLCLGKSD